MLQYTVSNPCRLSFSDLPDLNFTLGQPALTLDSSALTMTSGNCSDANLNLTLLSLYVSGSVISSPVVSTQTPNLIVFANELSQVLEYIVTYNLTTADALGYYNEKKSFKLIVIDPCTFVALTGPTKPVADELIMLDFDTGLLQIPIEGFDNNDCFYNVTFSVSNRATVNDVGSVFTSLDQFVSHPGNFLWITNAPAQLNVDSSSKDAVVFH